MNLNTIAANTKTNQTNQKRETKMKMPNTYEDAIDLMLEIISEMKASGNFHNPTLEELEERIV